MVRCAGVGFAAALICGAGTKKTGHPNPAVVEAAVVADVQLQMGQPRTEGPGWPIRSRKAHYFVEGRSLCGKWMWFGNPDDPTKGPPFGDADEDCRGCFNALGKHLRRKGGA